MDDRDENAPPLHSFSLTTQLSIYQIFLVIKDLHRTASLTHDKLPRTLFISRFQAAEALPEYRTAQGNTSYTLSQLICKLQPTFNKGPFYQNHTGTCVSLYKALFTFMVTTSRIFNVCMLFLLCTALSVLCGSVLTRLTPYFGFRDTKRCPRKSLPCKHSYRNTQPSNCDQENNVLPCAAITLPLSPFLYRSFIFRFHPFAQSHQARDLSS